MDDLGTGVRGGTRSMILTGHLETAEISQNRRPDTDFFFFAPAPSRNKCNPRRSDRSYRGAGVTKDCAEMVD